jgi:hypothetical protein
MKKKKIFKNFPIPSQTSINDKIFILKTINILNKKVNTYKYLEIGSYLGGSLTPFLLDENCKKIFSIDKREQCIADARNELWNYKNITENDMLNTIKQLGLNYKKILCFNGDIKNFKSKDKFDLIFIDGEHTNVKCFEDFIYSENLIKKNSIIMFHDSSIIHKALELILIHLKKKNFVFFKKNNSEMSAIFFGSYSKINHEKIYGKKDSIKKFFDKASDALLLQQLENRIKIKFSLSRFIKNKPYYKFYFKNKKIKTPHENSFIK